MGCLLCGKEIGPLRLLRDDEFCSSAHRERYHSRLGKALSSISAPEPPPAPVAGFKAEMPLQEGGRNYTSLLHSFGHGPRPIQIGRAFAIEIPPTLGGSLKSLGSIRASRGTGEFRAEWIVSTRVLPLTVELATDDGTERTSDYPPFAKFAPSLPAVPAERMVFAVDAAMPVAAAFHYMQPQAAWTAGAAHAGMAGFAPVPRAEEVMAFVQMSEDTAAVAFGGTIRLPEFAFTAQEESSQIAAPPAEAVVAAAGFAPVPRAEEVTSFVQMSADASAVSFATTIRLPEFTLTAEDEDSQSAAPAVLTAVAAADFAPVPRAEEVAAFVTLRADATPVAAPMAIRLPEFRLATDGESARTSTEKIEAVAACTGWMPAPAAEPVWSLVEASSAGWMAFGDAALAPALPQFAATEPFMPASLRIARPPAAEPAEAELLRSDAAVAAAMIPEIALPSTDRIFDLKPEIATYVRGPEAMPVESMPAAQAIQPAMAARAAIIGTVGAVQSPACSYGTTPARHDAEPVESMAIPAAHTEQVAGMEIRLPAAVTANAAESLGTAAEATTMPAAVELPVTAQPAAFQPLRTVALPRPRAEVRAASQTIPEAASIPVEYFCQRPGASPIRNIEWCAFSGDIVTPAFAVRPVFEKAEEEAAPQKKTSKKPAMAEVFEIAAAAKRKKTSPATQYAVKAIAASVVLGSVLWFGVGTLRIGNQTPAVNRDASVVDSSTTVAADQVLTPATSGQSSAPAPRKQPTGTMAKLRRAIAQRAASTVTDSFHNGMEAWGTAPKTFAAGWSRHPEGYVQPGQLALFRPSMNYTDYHLEFFGQIEHKSVGWTVRSKDTKNYYAMKFTVVDPGLRPIIAMVHYPVVEGRKGKPVQTPLNVMVHNNRPFQVAVDVHGNRMVTSIDGQEVDTWIDDSIKSGGVGFFADAGEKARLYWMKVSRNEDFLGRMCAYISGKLGDGTQATAEMWPPDPFPQQSPSHRGDMDYAEMTQSISAAGLLSISRRKRPGEIKARRGSWNS